MVGVLPLGGALPLVVALPLGGALPSVALPSVAPAAGGASGAGATDIAAAASSKVATGGAWSGEWSGDAWTGSSPSDAAWLGTGEAAGAAGVLSAGSDASFAALQLRHDQCAARMCPTLTCRFILGPIHRVWRYEFDANLAAGKALGSRLSGTHAG